MIGHAHPEIVDEIKKIVSEGTSYGANHSTEAEYAELICNQIPDMDMIRFVNSGTEAVMTAYDYLGGTQEKIK